jgi:hypothetical protein
VRRTEIDVLDLPAVRLSAGGGFTGDEKAYARQVIARALTDAEHPAEDARIRLTRHRGPEPFVVVQANVTVAERLVRAQSSAPTAAGAAGHAAARLSHRLSLLDRWLTGTRAGQPGIAGTPRAPLPPALPARPRPWPPATGRGLVRSKLVPLAVQPPEAAALTMTLRDYDFHLFADDDTGAESLVHRSGSGGYGVLLGDARRALPLPEAVECLNASLARPYLFFADPGTGRGRVLYRRYDGHLGLIAPAW